MAFLLSAGVIACWSTTWLAIKLHLGVVSPEVSLFYRMTIASLILFVWALATKKNLHYSKKTHAFFALQGISNFCINYLLTYLAAQYIPSGINAVVFALLLPLNTINMSLFFKERVDAFFTFCGMLSVSGVAIMFWPQLSLLDFSDTQVVGLALALSATICASLGNMAATRNQKAKLPIMQTNAYSIGYGAIFCFLIVLIQGKPLILNLDPTYWISLLHLAFIGTVVAFGLYFKLVQVMGAAKAPYPLLLVPVVALIISKYFEGLSFTPYAVAGICIILFSNLLVLYRKTLLQKRKLQS